MTKLRQLAVFYLAIGFYWVVNKLVDLGVIPADEDDSTTDSTTGH